MSRRRWFTAWVVTVASGGTVLAVAVFWHGRGSVVVSAVHGFGVVVAGAAMLTAARDGDARLRKARRWLTAALAFAAAGFLASAIYEAVLRTVPIPSAADALLLCWVPCAVLGLLAAPTEPYGAGGRLRAVLDGLIAASALLFSAWITVLHPVYARGGEHALAKATLLAYPVTDILVATLALSVAGHVRRDMRRLLRFIAAGLVLIAVSNSARAVSGGSGIARVSWVDVTLQAGLILVLWGALLPTQPAAATRERAGSTLDAGLPYLPILIAIPIGLDRAFTGHPINGPESLIAAVMIGGLLGRQLLYALNLGSVARSLAADAGRDGLTGLANRASFLSSVDVALAEAPADRLALILLDLDGFKEVNDSFGHAAGDAVLVEFAQRLQAHASASAVPARLGGDEFAVLIADAEAELVALDYAQQLRSPGPVAFGGLSVPTSASAGVTLNRPGDQVADILRRADLAMYEAKRSPLSHTSVFDDQMADRTQRRHLLANALAQAADRGELHLVYQPVHRLEGATLAGAEAFCRWRHPLYGEVSPGEFVPLAVELGLIDMIGAWVLTTAIRQVSHWQSAGLSLPRLFVEVSAGELDGPLPDTILEACAQNQLPPRQLTLAIAETWRPELRANSALARLRAAGVQIATGDFGPGFAGLARLPVDTLILHRELIRGSHTPRGEQVLRAVIGLADSLGLATLAEGVAQAAEAMRLAEAGCGLAKGDHYGGPLTAESFLARFAGQQLSQPAGENS